MSIGYDEMTKRQLAIQTILQTASATLARGLPEAPGVYLGPARETLDGKHFCVFIARRGLPEINYNMGNDSAVWTVNFEIALQSYWPEDAATLELYCGYLAANLLAVMHDNAKRSGADGWNKGILQSTDAIRLRREGREGAYEIEVVPFYATYEVSY